MLLAIADHVRETLNIDLPDLESREHIALDVDALGELHFEQAGDEIVVSLARPFEPGAEVLRIQMEALRKVHPDATQGARFQVGRQGERLVFIARLSGQSTNRRDLDDTVALMGAMHDDVQRHR